MQVSIIGDGGWGTALALVLAGNGHNVTVWGPFSDYISEIRESSENRKFLPGIKLPEEIQWTHTREEAAADADMAVIAIPSKFFEQVVSSFSSIIPRRCMLVSVTKGLQADSGMRMTQLAGKLLGRNDVAALSGPSHAEEVARGIPTAVVVASQDPHRAKHIQDIFTTKFFRVYTSTDIVGVEFGGALKNIMAIAVGVSDGLGFGDNTRAALMTRGLAEMRRLGCTYGASEETFAGLSGIGDLIVTCTSRLSRNRSVGERLGHGEEIGEILGSMEQVAEGVTNCAVALKMAETAGVEVPITKEVNDLIYGGKEPRAAVESLLTRPPRPEADV